MNNLQAIWITAESPNAAQLCLSFIQEHSYAIADENGDV